MENDTERSKTLREKLAAEKVALRRERKTAFAVLAVFLCIVAAAVLGKVIPARRLAKGTALLEAGDYEGAYAALSGLNYKDSAEKLEKCLPAVQLSRLGEVTVGSTIFFGVYEQDGDPADGGEEIEWLVLDVDGDRALVISKYALEKRRVEDESNAYSSYSWARSELRGWLNDEFFNAAFAPELQGRILISDVPADKNPDCDVSPGRDSKDRIFLLSIDEARRYFSSDSARVCKPTKYVLSQTPETGEGGACRWWLRTPGFDTGSAALVLPDGAVFTNGFSTDHRPTPTVRPAMWISLSGG